MGECQCGNDCQCNYSARALGEIKRVMSEIRASGKCGEITVKWNGAAWEIRKCEPPVIVREV